jgi:HK97 family phage prohead protease
VSERALGPITCKAVGPRTIETTLSSPKPDRMRDTIVQNWRLGDYRRNPVVFWNHQTQELPIARSVWIDVVNGQLKSRDEFPPAGLHPFADRVHDLVVAGFVNAKSVGFMPIRKVYNDARAGWDFLENELLEHSYVGLPANVDATIDSRATPDSVAVRRWFARSSRAEPELLELDDDYTVSRCEVLDAAKLIIPPLVRQAILRTRGTESFDLESVPSAFDPYGCAADAQMLADALRTTLPLLVRTELNCLRGQID